LQEIRTLLEGMPKDSPARPELIDIISSYHQARANDLRDKVRHQEAAAELAKVIELDPNRAEAYLSLGDLYRGSSAAWDRAVESYQKALVLGKDSLHAEDVTRAHWEIGEIRRQQKRWKDSAMAYREVWLRDKAFNLRLGERLVETIKEFAQEMRGSKPEAALAAVEEGIRVRATEADLHVTRGELLASLNRPDEATKAFEEALRLNPRLRGVHYAIALNFEKNGETLVAREWLEKEITGNPGHYDSLLKLGQLALERDDFGAAELFFTRARNVDPDLPQAPLGLSRVYRRQKEQQKARDMANEVLVRFPEDRYAHLEMGKILLDESNLEQARQYFSSVLDLVDKARLDPEASDRLNKAELDRLAADALLARGAVGLLTAGPGTANADFRKALEVVPDYPEAYFAIGAAYRKKFASSKRLEDLKEAETNMLKARELTPKNAQYALELGILYSQELAQSDKDNEKAHRERAVEHWRDYIKLGGANVGQVEAWIREISG
jgi:tetratricopeptide (TPR) repeat protein